MCKGNSSHQMIGGPAKVHTSEANGFSEDQNHSAVAVAYQCSVCKWHLRRDYEYAPSDCSDVRPMGRRHQDLSDDDSTWRPTANETQDYRDGSCQFSECPCCLLSGNG